MGEAEPAGVDAEDDFVGADFDDGVVGEVEAVGSGVGAEEGGPGGPEFGVELRGQEVVSGAEGMGREAGPSLCSG